MMTSSSTTSHGFLLLLVIDVLFVTATASYMAPTAATKSQFCDECRPEIFDITQPLSRSGLPTWRANISIPDAMRLVLKTNYSSIYLGTHWGTHVDSLGHLSEFEDDPTVMADSLSLNTLMGPVLVVEVPPETNITARYLQSLNLPKGLKRVIFKTVNTEKRLAEDKDYFHSNYTGFTGMGAKWLVENTNISFVGLDYMSVSICAKSVLHYVHFLFLTNNVIPVEFLKLDGIEPGYYTVYCLHLKVNIDGAPARCILVR
ncbi:OLC1v1025460C1 [Oldenlandia corymbosa var. corymbosa]|uniref:OLC1v1025460C1 n=1 Tax=Oldenlandia corymbosa var. corymbosa TaxID=529605 RepID=A0AAV1C7U9_OLDCO|nr:OLC1v1025460C1 [Oldenlandia corymbosa var. corymbosa]